MKIILFDIIGDKSGCKYYDIAFYKQLINHGFKAEIHSNFSYSNQSPLYYNIYKGNKTKKIFNLIYLIPSYILDILRNRSNVFVYMTYGELVDCILILLLILFHQRPILDVHEFISIDNQNNRLYKILFRFIYKRIAVVIYHSARTHKKLDSIIFNGKRLYVPHFRYDFPKQYVFEELEQSIKEAISPFRLNILFFGHMRKSKGIETVLDSILRTNTKILDSFHFIFAGDDSKQIVKERIDIIKRHCSLTTILRFIKDEELNYLFDKSNLVLLPYDEVSQSGILETAVYFQKTMILSDVEYFRNFNKEYPSFSYLIRKSNSSDLSDLYLTISENGIKGYEKDDLNKFYQKELFESFFNELKRIL